VAININLTPERSVEELVFRKRLAFWALTTGRTIIIVTECVVLVVFLARFYFDKKIFDLASSIEQKSVILEQKADFEKEFRKNYFELVKQQRDIGCLKKSVEEIKIKNKNEYRSEREIIKRDAIPSSIIAYISEKVIINIDENENTYTKKKEYREFCSYIL